MTRRGPGRSGGSALWVFLGSLATVAACGGAARDVVPDSKDVVANDPKGVTPTRGVEGYDYVARRPLAVVALAEARGIAPETARAAVDRLADRLDACVTDESRNGGHVDGAARVIAQIGPNGDVSATSVRIDPGENAAQSAVVCLVAPLKLLTFPPADLPTRGIAIEALWGQLQTKTPGASP